MRLTDVRLRCPVLLALPVLVVLAAAQSVPAKESGCIQIKCAPGIQIFLDGEFKAVSNPEVGGLILQDVLVGTHVIRAVRDGFAPRESQVVVSAGQVLVYEIGQLIPEVTIEEFGEETDFDTSAMVGRIVVQSLPVECLITIPGAGVEQYRKHKDTVELDNVAAGTHNVTFTGLGKTLSKSFEVPRNGLVKLFANFVEETVEIVCSGWVPVEIHPGSSPAWSPKGDRIAFEWGGDIWVIPLTGGDATRLTEDGEQNILPSWSPDGGKIVFTSRRSGAPDLWIIPAAGGNAIQLTEDRELDWFPAWSPDGSKIAFTKIDHLYILPLGGGPATELPNSIPHAWGADWSPDGSKIAFSGSTSEGQDVWVVSASGGEVERLTSHPADDRNPSWSPDGSRIAFVSNRSGHFNLWIMSATGETATQVITCPETTSADGVSWSPDSKKIAFAAKRERDKELHVFVVEVD